MPTLPIPTTSDGADTDWTVTGTSGWEAVLKGSDDSTYVFSASNGNESTFNCGPGWRTSPGRIMALTVHYRMRQTAAVGATVELYITQGGTNQSAGNVVIPAAGTSWVNGTARVRLDWTTSQRFSLIDVADLGVGVHMVSAPVSGQLEVSQLWVEVEYVDTPYLYDPVDGFKPDSVTGPLTWATSGTQAAVTGFDKYLTITDTSIVDTRFYQHMDYDGMREFTTDYVIEIETRLIINDTNAVADVPVFRLLGMDDDFKSIGVMATKFGGDYYLCFTPAFTFPPASLADCIAYVPFDYDGLDIHVRLRTDRDAYPDTYGKTQLFLNYSETPILEVDTADLPSSSLSEPRYIFGSTITGECVAKVDYYTWKAYRKRGNNFSGWSNYEFSTNEIHEDSVDPDVVQLQTIDPPGVTVGQSNYACRFDVNDSNELCRLYQVATLVAATNYKIDVDYKMDLGGVDGEVVVQRLPDLYFWDETGGVWSATPSSVDLTNTLTRDRVSVMTGVNLSATEQVVVSVQAKITAAAVHKIWIYKVYLVEE